MNKPKTDDERGRMAAEIEILKQWVVDLQSGMYVNCVYCGHRYGPGETTPVSMADALRAHVEACPRHPMSKMRTTLMEIASGELGINLCVIFAKKALER